MMPCPRAHSQRSGHGFGPAVLHAVSRRISRSMWRKEKGYYSEAGLEVDILPGRGSTFAAMTVGAGKEEFGIADAGAVSRPRAQGRAGHCRRPICSRTTASALIATEKSGINKVEASQGPQCRRVPRAAPRRSSCRPCSRSTASPWTTSSRLRGGSGTDLPLLLDGKIDAEVTVYNNEVVGLAHRASGIEARGLDHVDRSDSTRRATRIITSEELLKQEAAACQCLHQGAR